MSLLLGFGSRRPSGRERPEGGAATKGMGPHHAAFAEATFQRRRLQVVGIICVVLGVCSLAVGAYGS